MSRRGCLGLFLALLGAVPAVAQPIAGTSLESHRTQDELGRDITFYVSRPAQPAPLVLMIQGSGCDKVMHLEGGQPHSTLYNLMPHANDGRFTVLAVEKPFAGRSGGTPGTALGCDAAFNADFTAESWLAALRASIDAAMRLPWVRKDRLLAFGTSEGAVMAALLAGRDARVTDVIAFGGSGTTQLFDMIALAYQRCFDRAACIADVERNGRAISAAPDSATDFAWGHPYKRWSSFFAIDPSGELLRSRARVYIGFGTDDRAVPALSQEVAVARLLAAGREVTVRRVPDVGHSLVPEGAQDWSALDAEHKAALDWFATGRR